MNIFSSGLGLIKFLNIKEWYYLIAFVILLTPSCRKKDVPPNTNFDSIAYKNSIDWPGANLNARMTIYNGYLFVTEYVTNKVAVFDIVSDPFVPKLIQEIPTGCKNM